MNGFTSQSDFAASTRSVLQTAFANITGTVTTTATTWPASGTAQDLLTVTLTTSAGTALLIFFASSSNNLASGNETNFRVLVDTFFPTVTPTGQGGGVGLPTNGLASCMINLKATGLSAGSHTVKVQWKGNGSTCSIDAAGDPDGEGASLTVMEVSV